MHVIGHTGSVKTIKGFGVVAIWWCVPIGTQSLNADIIVIIHVVALSPCRLVALGRGIYLPSPPF